MNRTARVSGLLTALAVVAGLAIGGPIPIPVEAQTKSPVEEIGELPLPSGAVVKIVAIDNARRRMHVVYNNVTRGPSTTVGGVNLAPGAMQGTLLTYDLTPRLPRILSSRDISVPGDVPSRYLGFVETTRKHLYMITSDHNTETVIRAVPLESDEPVRRFEMAKALPGFWAMGMTYSAQDDRIYLVGEMQLVREIALWSGTFGRKLTGVVPVVAAIDPDDGSLLWARPVPECGQPLYTLTVGTLLARSSPAKPEPSLFFPCGTGGSGFGDSYPGTSGLVDLRISPTAGMADAAQFDVHFHPISGSYFNGAATGIAAFDPATERFFLQSLSPTTPGAWVFDGRKQAWVGFITADNNANFWLGLHEGTGHFMMGGTFPTSQTGFALIADGRATPPQNGVLLDKKYIPRGFITADPGSNRFFVPVVGSNTKFLVLDDMTGSALPRESVDYDADTDDIVETPETYVNFSGDTDGFGARVTAVGGTTGPLSTAGVFAPSSGTVPLWGASRSVALARSSGLAVRPAGATASAQASAIDGGTAKDLNDHSQDPTAPDDPDDPADDNAYPLVRWPHGTESCLDGGEGVDNPPEETREGFAGVTCNLKGFEATAEATHTATTTSDSTVGRSHYESKVTRTAKQGVRTDTTSFASGIHLDVPEVGALDIGKVTAKATTVAHGRTGTAKATWTRVVDDVTVRDLAGKPLLHEAGCTTVVEHDGTSPKPKVDNRHTSCEAIAEAVRKALQVKVRLKFPMPEVVATPKGAFAGIAQSDADHAHEVTVNDQGVVLTGDTVTKRTVPALQIDLYYDAVERARSVVQLAGIGASSIFGVNAALTDPPCDMGGCIPGLDGGDFADIGGDVESVGADLGLGDVALGGLSDSSSPSIVNGGGTGIPRSVTNPVAYGLAFARRGLGQALLMTSLLLLCAAAVGSVSRRRRLLTSLTPR